MKSQHRADHDPRWSALASRDPKADARFVYAVRTTGIYCRPSCPARRPKPQNVEFHDTCAAAERAGFRPCLRCHPRGPAIRDSHAAVVADICQYLASAPEQSDLKSLAKRAGLSSYHFHRVFKATTGLTPKAYTMAQRAQRIGAELRHSSTVTQAYQDAGYNSSGRFYANARDIIGMTPTSFRKGGLDTQIHFAFGQSSLGLVLAARSKRGLCAILLGDHRQTLREDLQERFPSAALVPADADFDYWVDQVVTLVDAPQTGCNLPLEIRGTAFQQRVWQALRKIPVGSTASYTQVAQRIGAPKSARAVALACGANALAVAIPCHRVVRSDGTVSGYRWGIGRKRALLELEGAVAKVVQTA